MTVRKECCLATAAHMNLVCGYTAGTRIVQAQSQPNPIMVKGGEHKISDLLKSSQMLIAGKSKGKSSKEVDLSKTNTCQWKVIHPTINRQQTCRYWTLLDYF